MNTIILNDENKQVHLERICRCCLIERINMKPIFDACLPQLLMACANIAVSTNDGLPSLICFQCVQQVNRSFTFRQQCERSDSMLRHWFHSSTTSGANHVDEICLNNNLQQSQPTDIPSNTSELQQIPTTTTVSTSDINASSNNVKLEIFNVLLEYTDNSDPTELDKSSILLPIGNETSQHIQTVFLDQTTVSSSAINETPEVTITTIKKDPITSLIVNTDVDDLDHHIPELTNDVLIAQSAANHMTLDPTVDDHLHDVDAHMPENDELIDAEFLTDKMPVIPDDYIELMNSFVASEDDEDPTTKLIDSPLIGLSGKPFDKLSPKKKSKNVANANGPLIVCEICQKEFQNSTSFRRHKITHDPRPVLICQYCSRQFSESNSLNKHVKRHIGKKRFLCSVCSATFYEGNDLKVHMRTHTGERPYECLVCGKAFAQSCQLERHKFSHNSAKENICEICKKGFKLKWHLKIHMRIHNDEKPYACPQCDKRFSQIGHLTIHKRTHTGDKPYVCSDCGKSFGNPSQLKLHMRKHSNDQPELKVTCNECGKKFPNNTSLKIHIRSHTDERPFACKICSRRFKMQAHLVVHVRSHTGEKPYKCGKCDKAFASSSILKKHTFIHTGEKNYACRVCNKTFTQPGGRLMHERTHYKQNKLQTLPDTQIEREKSLEKCAVNSLEELMSD